MCSNAYPSGWGYSAVFYNLPQGTQGQGYTDLNCKNLRFAVYGPGTECWKSGGGARAASVNWFHSPKRRDDTAADAEPESDPKACAIPVSFHYTDAEGNEQAIAIGSVEDSHRIGDLYVAGNFTALAAYPKCKSSVVLRRPELANTDNLQTFRPLSGQAHGTSPGRACLYS